MAYRYDFVATGETTETWKPSRIFLGTDFTLPFTVYDMEGKTQAEVEAEIEAGTATEVDVSGWDIRFAIKSAPKNEDPGLIEKEVGQGITIEGTFGGSPPQRVVVTIEDTDSYDPDASPIVDLKPKKYWYALKRTDPGSETIIAYGQFQFLEAATHE